MKFNLFGGKKEPASDEQISLDYRLTFGSETGQRVLQDLCETLHLLEPSYNPGSDMETAFREGERNALLYILSRLKLPEETTKNIIEEAIENG